MINNEDIHGFKYPTVSQIINAPENKGLIRWRKK